MKLCQNIQDEKKKLQVCRTSLLQLLLLLWVCFYCSSRIISTNSHISFVQVQIRMEVITWRERAQNGDEVDECREHILDMLSRFRLAQEKQDDLIEREKLRLDTFRNCINEDTTNRIKSRLTFFCRLNRQHEALLELVRQDVQDCKNICRRYQGSQSQPRWARLRWVMVFIRVR